MRRALRIGAIALPFLSVIGMAGAQAPGDDAEFASRLWRQLVDHRLVGSEAIGAVPYLRQGQAHGATLVSLFSTVTVGDLSGQVIVKRSYGGEGATREAIIASPAENLTNITVMFKRAAGYDPQNQDWFWAMYMPDGAVGRMGGNPVAGRVGMCISCHALAPGGDYVWLVDPPPIVRRVTFTPASVGVGANFLTEFSGTNLTDQTFFDVRFRAPGSTADQEIFNWQRGTSGAHSIPVGTPVGTWTLTGVRAHQADGDHSGTYQTVQAVLTVRP